MASSPVQEETQWNPHMGEPLTHVETRSPSPKSQADERRRSSTGTTSSPSVSDASTGHAGGHGRRSRPSITVASNQLDTVREMREQRQQRHLSDESTAAPSTERPSIASKINSQEGVVSSKKVLMSFSKVASRNTEKEAKRACQVSRYNQENAGQKAVHRRLVKWEEGRHMTWKQYFLSLAMPSWRQTPLPHEEELKALARHYYPPRAELKCHVCDFGQGRAEHKAVDLGQLEDFMIVKPDWVQVRWIHAPLGLGLMHSTIEDIFLHEGQNGREFENAGRAGWPFLETEIFSLRHRENFQEMRDVYLLLKDREELHKDLDQSTWNADRNSSVHHDIDWRSKHLALDPTFWNLVSSDMPWQLSEGLSMGSLSPKDGLKPVGRHVDKQSLAMSPFYRDAHLVRDPFRTFHRSDGFLLTLSPMAGVNYLDKDFSKHLAEPIDAMFDNDDASAVGHAFQAFADSGTDTWHRSTVEWFLVYLLTEVGVTPHPIRQGFNAPTLDSVYSSIIQDLKRRRFEKWAPKLTVKLVREYLSCMDELTYVTLNLKKKVDLFGVMLKDIAKFEAQDAHSELPLNNPEGESSTERLIWALNMTKQQHACFERLMLDLKQSLDALFQLRSIEQNDMAIVSDSQNKAIMVFTGVTIIFLPLSFFSSYYGMNLSGIVNTNKTEGYFWKVCGTVGFAIVLLVTLGAFRHNLRRMLRSKIGKAQRALV